MNICYPIILFLETFMKANFRFLNKTFDVGCEH